MISLKTWCDQILNPLNNYATGARRRRLRARCAGLASEDAREARGVAISAVAGARLSEIRMGEPRESLLVMTQRLRRAG
jgi:hypothetical protein